MTGRELVAAFQDRMLRDADEALYGDDMRTCGTCAAYDARPHMTFTGELFEGAMGLCGDLDLICDCDAPACRWWHE